MDRDAQADRLVGDGLVGIPDAGRFLSVSRRTIYKLIRRGDLPSAKIGDRRLIPKRGLILFAKRHLVHVAR